MQEITTAQSLGGGIRRAQRTNEDPPESFGKVNADTETDVLRPVDLLCAENSAVLTLVKGLRSRDSPRS